MGIKIVVNGYFRSGTSFIWNFLKKSLPNDFICFYEPLQLEIATAIQREKTNKTKDKLINQFLWQEYINLGEYQLHKLLRNHPSATNDGILNEKALEGYFDEINKLYSNILLQPNRLHFFLDFFKKRYNSKIIHVVRHPLDVYLSIINVDKTIYENSKRKNKIKYYLGRVIKKVPSIRTRLGEFEVEKDYLWIRRHVGLPYIQQDSWKMKYLNYQSYFEKMIIVWIFANYYAIKTINEENGYLLVYEELIKEPSKVAKDLEKYLEIKIEQIPKVKSGNSFKFKNKELKKLKKVIAKYKLEEYFEYINEEIKRRGINYL